MESMKQDRTSATITPSDLKSEFALNTSGELGNGEIHIITDFVGNRKHRTNEHEVHITS